MNFEKAKSTYRKNASVQLNMAKNLIKNVIKFKGENFDNIFEIGAGTGFLTDEILACLKFKKLTLNDLTENFTGVNTDYIQGDILEVEIPKNSDLIISNACFQWILDYDALFKKLHSNLKRGGLLAFSTFGEKNFVQIKDITGIGLHYPDLKEDVQKLGFKILYFEENLDTMYFNNVEEVLKHIKYTGVKTKNKIWTKTDLIDFREKYKKKYKDDMGFELTYHPLYYILEAI